MIDCRKFWIACVVAVTSWAGQLANAQESDTSIESPPGAQHLLLVVGAAGEETFGQQFETWAQRWVEAVAEAPGIHLTTVGIANSASRSDVDPPEQDLVEPVEEGDDRQRIQNWLRQVPDDAERVWVVFIGHGTASGKEAKFNLVGPDLSASELDQWLKPISTPVVIINCASSSGAFLPTLKAPGRIVVSATKSGAQYNFARFGDYLSQAIADPELDLDKDRQTSLLEAFVAASRETQAFYTQEKRLATELALLDDNGDGLGTPGDWFTGTKAQKASAKGEVDGKTAVGIVLIRRGQEATLSSAARQLRGQLEAELDALKARKASLAEDIYLAELETLMVKLARLYDDSDEPAEQPESSDAAPAADALPSTPAAGESEVPETQSDSDSEDKSKATAEDGR